MTGPLERRLGAFDPSAEISDDAILAALLDWIGEIGLELYPAQEEAILEIIAGNNVILNTPTGSGKSLVATALHFAAIARGRCSFYTCPIKALVSEKFFALCRDFGPENVGMMTGDASVNRDAPIICCTQEILANLALREGSNADVDDVVLDEFHYYADKERGVAWQVPLLELSQARFLLMSATMGDSEPFAERLTTLNGSPTKIVKSSHRPVPLDFEYREIPLHETVADLVKKGRAPIYVVGFTQRACAEEAQNLMSVDFCSKEEKRAIADALVGVRFDSPYGKEIQRFIRHGVGVHHAGLLPKYRLTVEKLAQKGLLKVICGTDTLGVGVNIPIRTVLFTQLCKFDGEKTGILSVRDFQQISGRAGRKGFDDHGYVVAQAPAHVIENIRLEAKSSTGSSKNKKFVKRKPPDFGYVAFDRSTFDRLRTSEPEPLVSRFRVTHGMLIDMLGREGGGCMPMARLVNRSHGREPERRIEGRHALQLFQTLIDAGLVEKINGRAVVHADLQADFSLHHALSLYLVSTIEKLDPDSETYALDILTLVESILENPDIVLRKQVDKLKTIKVNELKAQGVEYDERMAELEKIEYPKPLREFVYTTFNDFAVIHPWAKGDNIRPKSIAREMFENLSSFSDYIRDYELQRAEGVLLRYLSDVTKTFLQTVPAWAKGERTDEIELFFRAIVRQVDASLLDEWERMKNAPVDVIVQKHDDSEPEIDDITKDEKTFTVLIRNAVWRVVRSFASKRYADAVEVVEPEPKWTFQKLEEEMRAFYTSRSLLLIDPAARSPNHMRIKKEDHAWRVEQTLCDPEEHNDAAIVFMVDLEKSRTERRPVLALTEIQV